MALRLPSSGKRKAAKKPIEVSLPLVVSCQKGVAEQRIPNMKGIMSARTKPLKVVEPVAIEALTSIVAFDLPTRQSRC